MPLDDDTRKALHEIRDMMASKFVQVDLNSERITKIQTLIEDHIRVCDGNKEVLASLASLMEDIKVSYKWSNRIRKVVLWFAPPIAALIAAYQSWKGM